MHRKYEILIYLKIMFVHLMLVRTLIIILKSWMKILEKNKTISDAMPEKTFKFICAPAYNIL